MKREAEPLLAQMRPPGKLPGQFWFDALFADTLLGGARDPQSRIVELLSDMKDDELLHVAKSNYMRAFSVAVAVVVTTRARGFAATNTQVWIPYSRRLAWVSGMFLRSLENWLMCGGEAHFQDIPTPAIGSTKYSRRAISILNRGVLLQADDDMGWVGVHR